MPVSEQGEITKAFEWLEDLSVLCEQDDYPHTINNVVSSTRILFRAGKTENCHAGHWLSCRGWSFTRLSHLRYVK